MREQVIESDRTMGGGRLKRLQIPVHVCVQIDLLLLDELHRGGRGDCL
jgi:ABC-type branched-subunit amino acid transport system ATPase component